MPFLVSFMLAVEAEMWYNLINFRLHIKKQAKGNIEPNKDAMIGSGLYAFAC